MLPRVVAAGIAKAPAGTTGAIRELTYHEINVISAGRYTVELNGERILASAGSAYIYMPGDRGGYTVAAGDETLVCQWVKFTWPHATTTSAYADLGRSCRLTTQSQVQVRHAFARLLDAFSSKGPAAELTAAAQLLDIVAVITAAAAHANAIKIDPRLTTGLAYMEEHLGETMLIGAIAAACGLSEDYFTRLFRRHLGLPPMQHLIRMRLQRARSLLVAEGHLPVTAIAKRCGFDDPGHFARLFRREFAVAPSEFRNQGAV